MLLTEYFAKIVKLIEEYSKTHLITDSSLSIDSRTEKIGIIKGRLTFYLALLASVIITAFVFFVFLQGRSTPKNSPIRININV